MQPSMMTPQDIADQLHVTRRRAAELIRLGVIPSVKLRGRVYVPALAWQRWNEQQAEAALAACGGVQRAS